MPKAHKSPQLSLFDLDGGREYDRDFIMHNPILAVCTKGKSPHCRGKPEQIYAPQLENVCCFWCWGKMKAVDAVAYKARLVTLWQHLKED